MIDIRIIRLIYYVVSSVIVVDTLFFNNVITLFVLLICISYSAFLFFKK